MSKPLIVVFGSSRTKEQRHLDAAERLGELLATAKFDVGSGGYTAVMNAVSKGAYQAGGHVIGYTTDEFPEATPTPWLTEERRTADIHLRIQSMLAEGDGFIATWGGIGTLVEVTFAWNVGQFIAERDLPHKPLLLVGAHWQPLVQSIAAQTEIGSSVLSYPVLVDTVEEAVAYLSENIGNKK